MFSSFLFSKPCLCISSFIVGIAFCIQIDLILGQVSFTSFAVKLFLECASFYSKLTTPYIAPTSIGNHIQIEHNLCSTKYNGIASCQLVAIYTAAAMAMPNCTHILQHEPHTFLKVMNELSIGNNDPPFGTYYEFFDIEGLPVLLVHKSPKLTKKKLFASGVIIELHGGGYVIGTHKQLHQYISYLHLFTALPVLSVGYRLAPQYPLQSGALLEDAEKVVMNYLHQHLSVDFNNIYLTGESAGGGAILMWMHHFHRQGKYFGGVIPISPWLDISIPYSLQSYTENHEMDSMLNHDAMQLFQMYALGCRDMNGELVDHDVDKCITNGLNELNRKQMNPMSADWSIWSQQNNITKILFIASKYEVLRDDAVMAHKKALNLGIDSELIMVDSCLHIAPVYVNTPEAFQLIAKIASFLNNIVL